jgi:hypothetical protein
MDKVLKAYNRRVRAFGAANGVRMRRKEDDEIVLLLGPRKTENQAGFHRSPDVWELSGTAPSPFRVVQSLSAYAVSSWTGEFEFQIRVREKDLLTAAALTSWTKPRWRRGVERAKEAASGLAGLAELLQD